MRYAALLLALLIAAPLAFGQDDKPKDKPQEEPKVDLAVAFPATTMVYLRADTSDYLDAINPEEMFAGLESDLKLPNLGEIARDRLELKLSDEEVAALTRGVRGAAGGLLDVGVSGPKFEIVINHEHLGALARALKQAHDEDASTVPDVEDYYGTPVYELDLPLPPTQPNNNIPVGVNPLENWFSTQTFWVAILKNHYLVVATGDNAVKDAVDYLSFPDDPVDTLLGNARYKEAIKDFDKPQGLLFVNIQSVINTVERLTGDKGSASGGIWEMLAYRSGITPEQIQFFVGLLQYEQFKSFAAGFWIDEKALTLRMDANLVFHNAPGWFNAVRVEPKPMPLTSFIPENAVFAATDCVDDVGGLYQHVKDFFFERCKAAGQQDLIDGWNRAEERLQDKDTGLKEALGQLGGGQAFVVIPRAEDSKHDEEAAAQSDTDWAVILGVKDRTKAEKYFYEKMIDTPLGAPFQDAESALAPVTCVNDVEIHHNNAGTVAFAFVDDEAGSAFIIGDVYGVKAVVQAHSAAQNLSSMASWQKAHKLLWDAGSTHMYVNLGAAIRSMSGIGMYARGMAFGGWSDGTDSAQFDRDDTEKDDDPIPFLSDFFKDTIIVGSARSNDTGINVRVAAAGWPDRTAMRSMALHYRDVERNHQVRDDFVRLRDAARAQLAIKGKPAKQVSELIKSGVLTREKWAVDPYGADDKQAKARDYELAEVPDDVDIRQAILCAYQSEPGLRGNYLTVLWNSHIVEMTPVQLERAKQLASQGKQLPPDGKWYQNPMKPLHAQRDPREAAYQDEWRDSNKITVTIFDDDGNESTVDVDVGPDNQQANLMHRTEEILKAKDKEKAD